MAIAFKDRVKTECTTIGTGDIVFGATRHGFQDWSKVPNGEKVYYCLLNVDEWEVGYGIKSTGGIQRNVLDSTTGSKISLTGGADVFLTYPADGVVAKDESGNLIIDGTITATEVYADNLTLEGLGLANHEKIVVDTNGVISGDGGGLTNLNIDLADNGLANHDKITVDELGNLGANSISIDTSLGYPNNWSVTGQPTSFNVSQSGATKASVGSDGKLTATGFVGDGSELTGLNIPEALPDQTGQDGKYLQTDGTVATWQEVVGGGEGTVADGCIYLNNQVITSDYVFPLGKNGMSGGPISIDGSVEVGDGTWTIVGESGLGGGETTDILPVLYSGIVNADGTVKVGTGFTSTKTATGVYDVTFSSPLKDTNYSVNAFDEFIPTSASLRIYRVTNQTTNGFTIQSWKSVDSTPIDGTFNLTVTGTETISVGGGSASGDSATLESLGIPNHDKVTVEEVNGNNFVKVTHDNGKVTGWRWQQDGAFGEFNFTDNRFNNVRQADDSYELFTNGQQRLKIDADGQVFQETGSPNTLYQANGTLGYGKFGTRGNCTVLDTNCVDGLQFRINDTTKMQVGTDGRVDITGSLYVNGSAVGGGMTVALNYNETNTTMNHSKGVSSVTVESAGSLVINFSTPFPSNYYVWAGTARWNDGVNGNGMIGTSEGWVKDTSKIKIHVFDSARGSSTSKFSSSEVNFMATM